MQRTRACGRAALNLSKYDDASPWIALNMRRILRIFANSGSVGSILYVRRRFWLLLQEYMEIFDVKLCQQLEALKVSG